MTAAQVQNTLHAELTRLVNGGAASRPGTLLALALPALQRRRAAATLARRFAAWSAAPAVATVGSVRVVVRPCESQHAAVRAMTAALAPLTGLLHSAYVHGSLGSEEEEVAYSDFDALVILRDATVRDPARLAAAAAALTATRRIMQAYDPLQHHGWFVLTESDLRCYCQAYFPHQLFEYARVMVPAGAVTLDLQLRDSAAEYRAAFAGLAGLLRRQFAGRPPGNLYELKDVLSRMLVLPARYLQARDGTAVYKKWSFDLAAADFPGDAWAVMEEIQALRRDWQLPLRGWQRRLLGQVVARRRLVLPLAAPRIPAELAARLGPSLWQRADRLVGQMQARVAAAGR
ncbi:MAG: hypothetical protein FJ197_09210 [Gammaproteobacteria bacterium]|nr:hypothetical protein [Gammaproteobacteria bacterium]